MDNTSLTELIMAHVIDAWTVLLNMKFQNSLSDEYVLLFNRSKVTGLKIIK